MRRGQKHIATRKNNKKRVVAVSMVDFNAEGSNESMALRTLCRKIYSSLLAQQKYSKRLEHFIGRAQNQVK